MKKITAIIAFLFCTLLAGAKDYSVFSPDSRIQVKVTTGAKTEWSVAFDGRTILAPSPLSMTFSSGKVIGDNMKEPWHGVLVIFSQNLVLLLAHW